MPSSKICVFFFCSMVCMWSSVQSWSYFYSDTTMDWETARTWCKTHYTDMVAIQNQEEIAYLNSWLPKKKGYYWIGIRKISNVWTWVGTNKSLTAEATNWAKGEPNNGKKKKNTGQSEDCVEMYIKREQQAGKWNDELCGNLKTALCYSAACRKNSCIHGECVETINSTRCECAPGFHGEKCEHVVKCDKEEVISPSNGGVTCTHKFGNFTYNSTCQYSCVAGYQLSAAGPQTCTKTGNWSTMSPTCQLIQCQKLSSPTRGSIKCSDPLGPSSYQSTCVFTCDEGYELEDSSSDVLQCESSGSWNASRPSCVAVQCPALQELDHGNISCEDDSEMRFSFGKSCSFSCARGYRLVGQNTLTCTSAAEWSDLMPRCEAITCLNPEAAAHVIQQCSKSELRPNSTCSFKCESGYQLQGADTIKCSESGLWNEATPTCTAVQCPALQELDHGDVSCEDDSEMRFSFGKSCSFGCAHGYRLVGQNTLTCTSAAEWSDLMPRCEAVQCPALQELDHGDVSCEDDSEMRFSFGKSCSFSCAHGYRLVGQNTLTCTSAAEWNDLIPRCEAVRCLLLEAPENSHINCSDSDPVFNTQCSFMCHRGFTLEGHNLLNCDHHGNWTGEKPTCQAPPLSRATVVTTGLAAGGTALASGLVITTWILKRLRQKASKFELSSNSDTEDPPQTYKSSADSLI